MSLKPALTVSYEAWRYTATILRENNSIITEWKTLDELMIAIDDALACHFHNSKEPYILDLSIPAIQFTFDSSRYATQP
jgi:hypothetical protein